MQHSTGGAVTMTDCASTVPPAGSKVLRQTGINLGHPFKNPPVSLTGN